MALHVVDRAPEQAQRPVFRWIAAAVGMLLVLLGILFLIPSLVVVILTAVVVAAGSDATAPELQAILIVGALAVGGAILWLSGVKLVRGKPRTVLFLRRFGFDDAKTFVSYAASEALGQRWRLVTLDDLDTTPVTTKRWKRWLLRLTIAGAVVAIIWLLISALQLLGNPDTTAVGNAVDNAVDQSSNPIEGAIAGFFAALVVAIVIALMTGVVVVFLVIIVALAGAFGFASVLTTRSLARAERNRWTPTTTRQELDAFLARTQHAKSRLFAPRVAVVRSANALWKEAVAGLADISDVVLIDISDPSESLLWELRMLSMRPNVQLVLIGAADRVRSLEATGGHDADDRAVLELLGDRHVLTYHDDRKSFARELRHMFDTAASRPGPADGSTPTITVSSR